MSKEIDLPTELARLKGKGWIESNRSGDTGIGKTIEDHLGIEENNLGEPDCLYRGMDIEIKARRINTSAMITLFTLEPGVRNLSDIQLMQTYGYVDAKGRQALKITLTHNIFTGQGLKLHVDYAGGTISIVDTNGLSPWMWTIADIHLKLHNLCIIYCYSKKEEGREYFQIRNATLASSLNDNCFFGSLEREI
ncbi:MAG: MvaI/BcnI family restriction endonuclease [Nitrososphaerales archaeon]